MKIKCVNFEQEILVGSVYGPNDNDLTFFSHLENDVLELGTGTELRILGGDWNLTLDNSPIESNIDCINMREIPSKRRTDWFASFLKKTNMIEPFRILNPLAKEFTYVPNDVRRENRSRLDFFAVAETLVPVIGAVKISDSVVTGFFDHKSVSMTIGKPKKYGKKSILKNEILKCPEITNRVKATIMEVYFQHVNRDTIPGHTITNWLEQLGLIFHKISQINVLKKGLALGEGGAGSGNNRIKGRN